MTKLNNRSNVHKAKIYNARNRAKYHHVLVERAKLEKVKQYDLAPCGIQSFVRELIDQAIADAANGRNHARS